MEQHGAGDQRAALYAFPAVHENDRILAEQLCDRRPNSCKRISAWRLILSQRVPNDGDGGGPGFRSMGALSQIHHMCETYVHERLCPTSTWLRTDEEAG
jgi:hypothetical protein